ncbi:MAG TPA: sulfotransferase [Anaerolineae bacterium]|jgi:hypothetical protein
MLITIIGRGHSGTRAISHTLMASGVFMGARLNDSGDMLPPDDLYEACRVFAKYVVYKGGLEWDFSQLHTMPIDPAFTRLVESYLSQVFRNRSENKGWKLPETTLIYPWIVRMFPDIHYIHWVRDPRESILGSHLTDDLSDFGVPYDKTDDVRLRRAISWKYQREIVKATPQPRFTCDVRFEDFVLRQDEAIQKLQTYLGFPLGKIIIRPEAVGRWKTDTGTHFFNFFQDDMTELGYTA